MPTATERLHWSFDHDTGLQRPHFGASLRAVLESWAPGTAHDGAVRRYDLLPNYAAGWHQAWLDGGRRVVHRQRRDRAQPRLLRWRTLPRHPTTTPPAANT